MASLNSEVDSPKEEDEVETGSVSYNPLSQYFQETDSNIKNDAMSETQGAFDPLANSDNGPDITSSSPSREKKQVSSSTEIKTEEEQVPSVCKYFIEDKSGEDIAGKAFFDSLAQQNTLPTKNIATSPMQPIGTTTTAIPSSSSSSSPAQEIVDDPFSASLKASESDRWHDAWIASSKTRQALNSVSMLPMGTYFPERDHLTTLGIVLEEDLIDPVRELMQIQMGNQSTIQRNILTAESVSQDENGLKKLIEANCYRAAVNLTGRLLVLQGQGAGKIGHATKITPKIIQIWFVRIALLVKLRQFAIAEVEAAPFGDCDKPDLYYEFYPQIYGARKGSMIPFSFRVILTELHVHLNQFPEALDKLHSILSTCDHIIRNLDANLSEDGSLLEMTETNRKASRSLWVDRKSRVLFSILNCLMMQKDYPSAVSVAHTLIGRTPDHVSAQLWSLLGRIFLQLGDVGGAQESFSQASKLRKGSNNLRDKVDQLICSGLMCIANNEFEPAFQKFSEANELDAANPLIVNNMAVCLLYVGRLREALKMLEGKIHQRPQQFLHEGILFNVCTLYELESSHSSERKQAMLNAVAANIGDGFNVSCLKLPVPS